MSLVERDLAPCANDGRSGDTTVSDHFWEPLGDHPVRRLNRKVGSTKLAGCGKPYGSTTDGGQSWGSDWTPVFASQGQWRARLASCGSMMLCDACSAREWAKSRARFQSQFEDHVAGGGQLLHLRLSLPHHRGSLLKDLLRALKREFRELRRSKAWADARIVDWTRVLHIRWSEENGYHPHFHVTALVPAGVELDLGAVIPDLQAAWKDRLFRAGFKRASRSGLFGRAFSSALDALYAWQRDADEPSEESDLYHPQSHLIRGDGYSPQIGSDWEEEGGDDDRYSWSPFDVARAAEAGDQKFFRLWQELVEAMYRVRVVVASDGLDEAWAFMNGSDAELPAVPEFEAEVVEVERVLAEPVVKVGNKLVARAVDYGCWSQGLEVGSSGGVLAAAEFWSAVLACPVLVDIGGDGIPLIWAEAIGPPRRGPAEPRVSVLCREVDLDRSLV